MSVLDTGIYRNVQKKVFIFKNESYRAGERGDVAVTVKNGNVSRSGRLFNLVFAAIILWRVRNRLQIG